MRDSHAVYIRHRRDGPSMSRAEWNGPGYLARGAVVE